jgi:hypothetical protein
MTVSIDATNLQLIDAADSTTGWTSSMGSLATDTQAPREGGTNLADQANNEQYNVYHTITSEDYSNRTIFGWNRQAIPDTEGAAAGAGLGMYLGDGTNNRAYDCGGIDNYNFYFQSWSGLRLNTAGLPTGFVQDGGGAPTVSTITRVGYCGQRPTKSNGTADNAFFDVLRYCSNSNPALLIEGGTTGARGTWGEVVTEDENTSNAWGIIRELITGAKAYEIMFGVQVGSLDSTAYFEDSDFQLYINGSLTSGGTISAGSMDFTFVGGGAFTNVINFNNFFIQSLGAVSNWDMSDTNIDELIWSDGQFVDMGTFTFQAQDAGNKTLTGITWVNCGKVDFVGIDADGITFNGASNADGAVEWNTNTVEENQDNITFNSDGTGHAIHINIDSAGATTYNIDGYTFDGYAGQSGTAGNRVFLITNPSDGDVTINVTNGQALNVQGGGAGFSYELAAGTTSTVSINQTVTLTATVTDADGAAVEGASVRIENASTGALISQGTTNASGVYSDGSYNYGGDLSVRTKVRLKGYKPFRTLGTIESTGISVGVTLQTDTIVDLP